MAMERSTLMSWTIEVIEDVMMRRPRLVVALLQLMAQRSLHLAQRIESFSVDRIDRRVARALIRFSERFGTKTEGGDGSIRLVKILELTETAGDGFTRPQLPL